MNLNIPAYVMDNSSQNNKSIISRAVQIVSLFPLTEKFVTMLNLFGHQKTYRARIILVFKCLTNLRVDQGHGECSSIGAKGSLQAFRFFFGTK